MSKKNKRKQKNNHHSPQINHQKQAMNQIPSSGLKMPFQSLTVTIKMDSDWHIGSGAGIPGDVDRLVQKDQDGFPYIPAKTLTGIWRDGCELVALGLDNGNEKGIWHSWIDYLFGEQPALPEVKLTQHPRPAVVSIRAASFSEDFKKAIESLENQQAKIVIKNALTFIKPGISIEPESGCAKEDHLRFTEMARIGASLKATCNLNFGNATEEEQKTAYALLLAGAKMVERIGGKRRRGSGRCSLVISGYEDIGAWLDWLESHIKQPIETPEFSLSAEEPNRDDTQANKKDDWVRIKLTLTTKTPLVITARTVGNVVESLDYIPGTHLLPIVSKRLGKNLHQAIAQGNLIVTNATVEINGERGRPVPLAMFYEKLEGGWKEGKGIYNRLVDKEPEKKQLKGSRQGYISVTSGKNLPLYKPSKDIISGISPHNTVDDKYQRPDKEIGGIYSYENIASGTILQAEIRLRKGLSDYLGKDWWKLLDGKVNIGQSKKDDYGLVCIQADVIESSNQNTSNKNVDSQTSELIVWLLSDVLLRDARLRPSTSIEDFKNVLEIKLNEGLESEEKIELDIRKSQDIVDTIARSRRTESWQVRWGLPRPSLVGLMAGTCIVFTVTKGKENITADKLAGIEMSGIGERTAEGYGQICFNDPLLTESALKKCQQSENDSNSNSNKFNKTILSKTNNNDFDYARIIEETAWKEAIQKAALFLASKKDSSKKDSSKEDSSKENYRYKILGIKLEIEENKQQKTSKPSMSQLGSLRSVLSNLESPGDAAITSWIKNRKDKWFIESKVSKSSLDKISDLITDSSKVWEYLEEGLEQIKHPKFGELVITEKGEESLKTKLWADAIKILVDTCIRAHKREWEESRN